MRKLIEKFKRESCLASPLVEEEQQQEGEGTTTTTLGCEEVHQAELDESAEAGVAVCDNDGDDGDDGDDDADVDGGSDTAAADR